MSGSALAAGNGFERILQQIKQYQWNLAVINTVTIVWADRCKTPA
jgi:hypothetical protein